MTAFPNVLATATTAFALNSSFVLTMPSGIQADELLVALVEGDSVTGDTMSGWTKIGTATSGSAQDLTVYGKIAAGSDTGTVSGAFAGRLGEVYQIADWSGVIADIGIAVSSSSTMDAPSLDMGASRDHLWLVFARTNAAAPSAAPTNYTNLLGVGSGSTVNLASARRALTAQTENPGAFTGTTTAAAAGVIGIRPGSSGGSDGFMPFFA